jgi:diaminopimelate decarboxylase
MPRHPLAAPLSGQWDEQSATIRGIAVEKLASAYGTPLYIYIADVMVNQFEMLKRALPDLDIYYSIKANPHPAVIELFLKRGAGCEIASGGEYALARSAGARPERVVFAGPGKSREELEFVIHNGISEIHAESYEELEVLESISRELNVAVNIAIRVNPSRASGGLSMGGHATVFGFEEESLPKVVNWLSTSKRLVLHGLHVYSGTQILDAAVLLDNWRCALQIAKQLVTLIDKPLSTLDFGGGLGIPYFSQERELDLQSIKDGAAKLFRDARYGALAQCRFLIEPGRFLAGPAGIYVARVLSVKTCRGSTFVVLDGGMNHHLAASGNLGQVVRRDYPILNLSRMNLADEIEVVVVGPLCTPIDTLGRKVCLPQPTAGSLVGILQSGAYGLTTSPINFLTHPTPAEVMISDGKHNLIRARGKTF